MQGTRKLGRPTAHRISMLRGLVTQTLSKGKITTTATRAQETARMVEKLITIAKKDTLAARRQAMEFVIREDKIRIKKETVREKNETIHKLFTVIAPAFAGRNGGYTRITMLGPRRGDAAEMAVLELMMEVKPVKSDDKGKAKGSKKPSKAKTEKPEPKAQKTEDNEAEE